MRPRNRKRWWVWFWLVYALVLAGSHAWVSQRSRSPARAEQARVEGDAHAITCTEFDNNGPAPGALLRVAYKEWGGDRLGVDPGDPLILIHGSPGEGKDFDKLGPLLAAGGRRVVAPDLPGFGGSTRRPVSYSTRAHARVVLAMMGKLGIRRAHVLGWSMGGGVVLNMADIAPERVASITMLAAIGDQSVEGSGSYWFEHGKYGAGRFALFGAYEFLPHFGLLGDPRRTIAYSTLRNFGDTDMRTLRPVMERLRIPTLIIAGRDDFLVQLRAPELHHRLIGPSKLVVFDAMHFMPFLQAEQTARLVGTFIEKDAPLAAAMDRSEAWEVPARAPAFGQMGAWVAASLRAAPWWALVLLVSLGTGRRPALAAAITAALVNGLMIDWGVALFGTFLGVAGRQFVDLVIGAGSRAGADTRGFSRIDWERRFSRRSPGFWLAWRAVFRPDIVDAAPRAAAALGSIFELALFLAGALVASLVWTLIVFMPMLIIAALAAMRFREWLGWSGTLLSLAVLWFWSANAPLLLTWTGRRMLLARLTRLKGHEYWPPWLFYAPLVAYMLWLAWRHGHPLAFTACNPGIEGGGGLIGESKVGVMDLIDAPDGVLLDAVLITEHPDPAERARTALRHIGEHGAVGDFPVILKPDAGLRGFGVRLVRRADELDDYFRSMTRPAMLQRYHPGPHEVGVLWARDMNGRAGRGGFIYSITRKDFPYVEGDGRHTLEQLIYRHPRHRCQAATFLARFADDASRVIPSGERVRLAQSGNHCQGTLFRDGADLVTPELTRAMDELALTFAGATHWGADVPGGLDMGRFDLRFESEDDLRAGRNFGVIELNGTTGESTNLYDPKKSLLWSYRVLFGQWRLLYELGAWRRSRGVEAWSVGTLLGELRRFYKGRPGSALAD